MNTHRVLENQKSKAIFAATDYRKNLSRPGLIALQFFVCLALLIGLAYSSRAQSCATCKQEKATIGFTGSACSAHNYTITLDGLSITGFGSCTANTWVTASQKGFRQLIVNKTYVVTAGTDSCSTHIVFDVPEEYKLEIDGIEKTVIDKSGGTTKGSGDGSWQIVVRKRCQACEGAAFGNPGNTNLGSIDWSVSLGNLSDGRWAQSINLIQDSITSAIYTPAALIYSPPGLTNEVDVVRNADQSLRQIKTTEGLADIVVTIAGQEYELRFYRPADVGAKVSGIYSVSGQPYITWKIKNPDPTSIKRLQLSKTQGSFTDTNEYAWDSVTNSWTLTRGGGASLETKAITYPSATSRSETSTVKESNGQIVSKVNRIYRTFGWGDELVQETVDPDGAALKTVYTYYENSAEPGRYSKLKSISHPDGSWEKYDYDTSGSKTLSMRPWKDLPLASATEANSKVTRYTYSNFDGVVTSLYAREISSIEEQVAGVTVRKTTYSRSGLTVNGNPAVREVETVYSSAAVTQISATTSYHFSADPFYANRPISIEYPDGKSTAYTYEKGNYVANVDPSLSQFTPDANGTARRETVVHGTTTSPAGVAFKTMEETSIRDQNGRMVLQESYVYNGATYERVGWAAMDYDSQGQLTQTRRNNGTVTTAVWNGDRTVSQTDANGIQTDYTYDALVRMRTRTKKGVAASGSFPAQADIVTTYDYNAAGMQINETTVGGGLSLSQASAFDLAGRIKSSTDAAGQVTTYTYANGGRTRTITLPGGASQTTDRFLDGQMKSVTGTGVVAQYFEYGVNADGTRYTQEFMGNAGLSSPRWKKTTSDWQGRTITLEKPTFSAAVVVQAWVYNNKGQLSKETTSAGANRLQADKLYEYDELGNQVRVGTDVDANGTLTLASTDRIGDTNMAYEKTGSDWFMVTTMSTYLANNDATATIETKRDRLNNFVLNGSQQTVSETFAIDVAGNSTRVVSLVDRAAKKNTTITDTPDSNIDAVGISINGLLQSSTASTPQSATTFVYDSLGRQVSVTDPRSGTKTQAYEATTGRLLSTSDAISTTTYEYYPATHANAGRIKSQANTVGKKAYFEYSLRGELIRNWGDTAYPVEYVYDSYGQRTELHTFRGGSNWQASVWPAATTGAADVTRWTYHEPTGLLTQKQDAALKGVSYTYDELGRMKIRTWARLDGLGNPLRCTYTYDPQTGEMTGIDYSDSTPDVTLGYDRGGRQATITDAAGVHARSFNVAGSLQTEQITGGILDLMQVSASFDSLLRRQFLQASRGAAVLASQTYSYDTASRLQTITSGSQTASYAYDPNSGLLSTTSFPGGNRIEKSYDPLGQLESITTTPAGGGVQSFSYTYNNLHQRTRVTREDGSYWSYIYNDRGELLSGKKYWADTSPVWGDQTENSFDNIGNRSAAKSGGNPLGQLRTSAYTANSLNQYSQRIVPGAADIAGTANSSATVSVNDGATARKADYFYKELTVDNSAAPVNAAVNIVGARNNFGAGGEDAVTETGGSVFLPRAVEAFTHDDDGNLTSDGRWNYTWDGENRLASMEAIPTVPVTAKRRLEFAYDWLGRRIQKKTYVWNTLTSSYKLESPVSFVYDGWNVMAEYVGLDTPTKSFIWGQDISGSLQGAGGIGGLLLINDGGDSYIAGYDGSENITALIKVSDGLLAASYEYDPFGNTVKLVGEYASENPIRFSTKYTDRETSLVNFGHRYYNSQIGRWLSRDPIAPENGINLYAYVVNAPTNFTDFDGLQGRERGFYHDKGRRYDASSPNWDFATGSLDWLYHDITLCVPKLKMEEAMSKMFEELVQFKYFEPNIANFKPVGANGGHFGLTDPSMAGTAELGGISIDVILYTRYANKQLLAVTRGDHPLVGVRMWRVEKAGTTANGTTVINVITEAYDQANGHLNNLGRYFSGRDQQMIMWKKYLSNIEAGWRQQYRATRVGRQRALLETDQKEPNPFKALLPAELQSTKWIYYDNILP